MQTKIHISIAKGILGIFTFSSLLTTVTLADDYMYVTATHLNVRSAGTYRSSIIATVDTGYKVTILESLSNGWKRVLLANGRIGYMNGRYLSDQAPYFEKALGSIYTVVVPHAFVRGEGLVTKIAVVHKGETLEVMDEKIFLGRWIRVRVINSKTGHYNGRIGYIAKPLVHVIEGSEYKQETGMSVLNNTSPMINDSWISENSSTKILNSAPLESTQKEGGDLEAKTNSGSHDTEEISSNLNNFGDIFKPLDEDQQNTDDIEQNIQAMPVDSEGTTQSLEEILGIQIK